MSESFFSAGLFVPRRSRTGTGSLFLLCEIRVYRRFRGSCKDGGGPAASIIKVDRRTTSTSELISLSLYAASCRARRLEGNDGEAEDEEEERRAGPARRGRGGGGTKAKKEMGSLGGRKRVE